MKIFLPFVIKDIGGTSIFAKKFTQSLQERNVTISSNFSFDFDTLFIIADCPIRYLLLAKLLNKKIIQRLDGVYHPATPAGRWYWLYNLKMKLIYNFFADTAIYQSRFSKLSCEKFLGKTRAKITAIIYNGVDLNTIPTKQNSILHSPIRLLTYAKFRRRDQIEPILESVKLLDQQQFSLDIYGSYTPDLEYLFRDLPPHIHFKGKKDNESLLKMLHQYDIFLFSDQSACPNSVLEATAAGLPVAAYDRGSIRELITPKKNGDIVPLPLHDPFAEQYPFTNNSYQTFSESVQKISNNLSQYQPMINDETKKRLEIRTMLNYYADILKKN